MLQPIKHIDRFKKTVKRELLKLSNSDSLFQSLTQDFLREGQLYIVGGYLRNIANGKTDSRDVDFISSLPTSQILAIIQELGLEYSVNRMEGIKVSCHSVKIDVWSISKNWSFANDRVKWNSDTNYRKDVLVKKIADGSFFNIDSLVLDVHSFRCSVSNYNHFVEFGMLDILRKRDRYKYQNPTREANILRAFFITKTYHVGLSDNTKTYIVNELKNLNSSKLRNATELILKKSYDYRDKYQSTISEGELTNFINSLLRDLGPLFEPPKQNV